MRLSEGKGNCLGAKAANIPVLFTPVEIPVEVAEPTKSAHEVLVVDLKLCADHGHPAGGRRSAIAQVVTPPPAEQTE
jgi:hypothetical protein